MLSNAQKFFDACESGKGYAGTNDYMTDDAIFNAQVTDSTPGHTTENL